MRVDVPGRPPIELDHALFDLNGTLTDRGALIDGVPELMRDLAARLRVHLLSADTFGTAGEIARKLGLDLQLVGAGAEKRHYLEELGPQRCAAVGNGSNDAPMLEAAALGIAVIGPEAASAAALRAADVVARSIHEALGVLLDPRLLTATLRA